MPDWSLRLGVALALWGLVTAPMASAAPAGALPRPDESARSHHEQGRRQFGQGQYEAAIAAYRKAYELKADPSYLLDIAEAYRALDVPERAVFFYNRYLSAHPNPPNRFEVEAEVARLRPRLPPAAEPGPVASAPLPAAGAPVPPAGTAPSSRSPAPGVDVGLAARPVREDQRPLVGRWWFWTAVGALAAAGATVAILSANRGGDQIPQSQLGHAKLF